jgi:hypothetical protein
MNNSLRAWDDETMTLAEQFQKDCHQIVEAAIKEADTPVSYQDATNMFLFNKLAELQMEILRLRTIILDPTNS